MNPSSLVRPAVLSQPVYEPGKPIEDVARELGLDPAGIVKLASNENPLGPSPRAVDAARRALGQAHLYPDGGCVALRRRIAQVRGLAPEQIVLGNGSNEVIELIGHAFLEPGDEVVMGQPEFAVYKLVTLLFGARPVEVPLVHFRNDLNRLRRAVTERTKVVFVATPNNPVGTAVGRDELLAFVRSLPEKVVCVVDEAYAEYHEEAPDVRELIAEGRTVIALRTFSKIHGLAGLRVGYGYASAAVAGFLGRVRQPFNVNAVAQAAALAALEDDDFVRRSIASNRAGLLQLEGGLRALGVEFVPSVANFILLRVGDGAGVFEALQRRGVIVRPLRPYDLPEWIRVTVGTQEQNGRFLAELAAALPSNRPVAAAVV